MNFQQFHLERLRREHDERVRQWRAPRHRQQHLYFRLGLLIGLLAGVALVAWVLL